jgi:pimeloyl-ACP methyl ester carboxylesterase
LLEIRLGPLTAQLSHWPLRINLPTLVLVHGAGFSAGFWQKQFALQNRLNLICLNLPGRQGGQNCSPHAQDYLNLIEAALQEIPTYFILGHSLGGGLALGHSLQAPERVQGLIMINSGARLKVAPSVMALFQGGSENPLSQMLLAGADMPLQDKQAMGAQVASIQNALADFNVCNEIDFMPRLGELTLPVLVVGSDNDPLTPAKYSQYLADQLADVRLSLVEGAGHLLPWTRPELLNLAITEFIFPPV